MTSPIIIQTIAMADQLECNMNINLGGAHPQLEPNA